MRPGLFRKLDPSFLHRGFLFPASKTFRHKQVGSSLKEEIKVQQAADVDEDFRIKQNTDTTPSSLISWSSDEEPSHDAHFALGALAALPAVPDAQVLIADAYARAATVPLASDTAQGASMSYQQRIRHHQFHLNRLEKFESSLLFSLSKLCAGFPAPASLHPFERDLLTLSLPNGLDSFLNTVRGGVDLRARLKEIALIHKRRLVKLRDDAGRARAFAEAAEDLARNLCDAPEYRALVELGRSVRSLSLLDLSAPTLLFIGSKGVGKSTLLRALSDDKVASQDSPSCMRGCLRGKLIDGDRSLQLLDTAALAFDHDSDQVLLLKSLLGLPFHASGPFIFLWTARVRRAAISLHSLINC